MPWTKLTMCLALLATAGCIGGEAGAMNDDDGSELPAALASLPADIEARAARLDELRRAFPDDADVLAAERQLERDSVRGLYRAIELDDGRRVAFVESGDGLILTESGPKGTRSVLAERGLSEASPSEIWTALLPGEPVPALIAAAGDATMQAETADDLQLELPTESAATGATFGGGDPAPLHVASEPPRTDGVALRQQALTDTQFFQAGGCVTRPSPGAADYAAIAEPFVCLTNWWNGFFAQATAIQFRFRFSHAQGDGFHVQFRRSGVLESTHFVAAGSWFNIRRGWVVHCRSSCCGFLCLSSCSSCRAVASDQRLDLANASGDRFHVGGFFLNSTDDRSDTHPW